MLLILYYKPDWLIKEKPVITPPIKQALKEKSITEAKNIGS
jgi:hypothetical protein